MLPLSRYKQLTQQKSTSDMSGILICAEALRQLVIFYHENFRKVRQKSINMPNLIPIWADLNKIIPLVYSDAKLNSPNFLPNLIQFTKYIIIIYALGSAHEKIGV